jgi:hypothetical protein
MRRHELDPLSLVFGLLLTGLGLVFLADRVDLAVRARWLWPVLLLGVGVAILLGARPRRAADGGTAAELAPAGDGGTTKELAPAADGPEQRDEQAER